MPSRAQVGWNTCTLLHRYTVHDPLFDYLERWHGVAHLMQSHVQVLLAGYINGGLEGLFHNQLQQRQVHICQHLQFTHMDLPKQKQSCVTSHTSDTSQQQHGLSFSHRYHEARTCLPTKTAT